MVERGALPVDPFCQPQQHNAPGALSNGVARSFHSNVAPRCPDETEVSRMIPAKSEVLSLRTEGAEARLVHFKKDDDVELEFLQNQHLVIFFPDGIFGEVEWSDETGSRKAPSFETWRSCL